MRQRLILLLALTACVIPAFSQFIPDIDNIKIKPYYEQGVYIGAITEPFEIESLEGKEGKMAFGVNTEDSGYFMVEIEPDSELYDAFYDTFGEVVEARYARLQENPMSMGLFPLEGPVNTYGLGELTQTLLIKDGEELYLKGNTNEPALFNFFKMDYRGDDNYIPLLMVISPSIMKSNGFTVEPEQNATGGMFWMSLTYNGETNTIPLTMVTPQLYKRLKQADAEFREE